MAENWTLMKKFTNGDFPSWALCKQQCKKTDNNKYILILFETKSP